MIDHGTIFQSYQAITLNVTVNQISAANRRMMIRTGT